MLTDNYFWASAGWGNTKTKCQFQFKAGGQDRTVDDQELVHQILGGKASYGTLHALGLLDEEGGLRVKPRLVERLPRVVLGRHESRIVGDQLEIAHRPVHSRRRRHPRPHLRRGQPIELR